MVLRAHVGLAGRSPERRNVLTSPPSRSGQAPHTGERRTVTAQVLDTGAAIESDGVPPAPFV